MSLEWPRTPQETRRLAGYPAPPFLDALGGALVEGSDVVVDGHVTTSRGPGTSLKFALELVSQLYGQEKADELKAQMLA